MKLLEVQPEIAPGAPPEPPHASRPEQVADPGARTCESCGATMEAGQDWCLACGSASGPLGERPGQRSSMTVLGLTLLLVAGAVGASYAALRKDGTTPAAQTPAAAQVAQVPPATAAPPPTTPPPTATTTTPATTSTSTGKSKLPKVQVPSNATPAPTPQTTPSTAAPRTTPPPPAASTPATTTPPSTSTGSGTATPTTPSQTTTPQPAAPVAIDIGASAASIYDPYRRATAVGVPAKAVDGDGSTSWFIDTAPGAPSVGAGFAVNLGQARGIKSIEVTTPTPGFKLEIYASDEVTPPPAITDTRWAHITDKGNVGEGGKTHIVLGGGSSKYQTLLLWITTPPTSGTRVRISELKVFG